MPNKDHTCFEWNLQHLMSRHRVKALISVARHLHSLMTSEYIYFATEDAGDMPSIVHVMCQITRN